MLLKFQIIIYVFQTYKLKPNGYLIQEVSTVLGWKWKKLVYVLRHLSYLGNHFNVPAAKYLAACDCNYYYTFPVISSSLLSLWPAKANRNCWEWRVRRTTELFPTPSLHVLYVLVRWHAQISLRKSVVHGVYSVSRAVTFPLFQIFCAKSTFSTLMVPP